MAQLIDLGSLDLNVKEYPYRYFYSNSRVPTSVCDQILDWLETCNHWKRKKTNFYTQYEFDLRDVNLPLEIEFLNSLEFKKQITNFAESVFLTTLSEVVEVVAHKLVSGDAIGIHNDYIEGRETHRVLVHFNRGWTEECGGYFMVFSNDKSESLVKLLPPLNGLIQGFEISESSYHAVSKISSGSRYTIIYSFYGTAQ